MLKLIGLVLVTLTPTASDVAYLVGGDGPGDPMALGTPGGTLFTVYDVLDNDVVVRWLWPGTSGEFVPKRAALTIKDRDETVLPRFRFCGLRTGRPEEVLWMRRMRMHDADGMNYGHSFEAWGAKYFAEHPDWFELDSKGVRHPGRSMCVSNRGFHKQISIGRSDRRVSCPKLFTLSELDPNTWARSKKLKR